MAKELKNDDLNKIYTEAEEADRDLYAEMRSNVLLISGEHYNRKSSKFYNRIREAKEIPETQRLRLTKNHLHKVYRHYVANILAYAPGVTIVPHNELEMQDRKDAELNKAVLEDAKNKHRVQEKVRQFAQDFVGVGEVACKIFYDPNKGDLKGFEPKMQMDEDGNPVAHPMTGEPMQEMDQNGQPAADTEKPIFSGSFVFERIFGFNLMRAPGCKTMEESPFLIIRKMVDLKELKIRYKGDEDKLKKLSPGKDETYIVFDSSRGEYMKTTEQVLIREFYWKPCMEYPMGYWAFSTSEGILEQGELPFGIFPIVWAGFDEYPTTPRGRSILKQVRAIQSEINRAASAMATHQITLGDDKVIYQAGTKLSPGALLPGVRGITFNGMPPQILSGRDGSQYLPYIESQIKELYDVAEMSEENEASPAQVDAYAMLYTSMKQLRKYAIYGEKFEQFLIDFWTIYLELAKKYLPDDELIYAIGRNEQVNIEEFRSTTKLCYQIKVEPRNETLETQLGKQLSMSHVLQYVGTQLGKDDIGRIMKNMPFGNGEEAFRNFTIDEDTIENDFLAIERGKQPDVNEYENHEKAVNLVVARMKEADFEFLAVPVKTAYLTYKAQHEKIMADQAQKLIDAKNEFIPVGGAMVAADLYIPNPDDPSKAAKRVRLPYQALDWLIQKLEAQNMPLQKLEHMNSGVVSDLVSMKQNQNGQQEAMPSPSQSPAPAGGQGQISPIGVS